MDLVFPVGVSIYFRDADKSNFTGQKLVFLSDPDWGRGIGTFDEQPKRANGSLLDYINQSDNRQLKRDSLPPESDLCGLARACFS